MITARWLKKAIVVLIGPVVVLGCTGPGGSSATSSVSEKSLVSEMVHNGELRLCVATAAVHSVQDPQTGQWHGVGVEPMRFAATTLNIKFVAVTTTWGDMIPALLANKCDIAGALDRTPARAVKIDYLPNYWTISAAFAYNKTKIVTTDPANWRASVDQAGVIIGVTQGSAADHFLEAPGFLKHATVKTLPDDNTRDLELQSGRVQFTYGDSDSLHLFAAKQTWATVLVPVPGIQVDYVSYGIRKGYSWDDNQFFQVLIDDLTNSGQMAAWTVQFKSLE